MAAPIVAGLARLGTMAYSAIQEASPEIKEQVVSYVKRATGGRVDSVPAIAQFASGSKQGAAVVTRAAVKNGINPDRLLTDEVLAEMRDQDLVNLRNKLREEFKQIYGAIDAQSVFVPTGDNARDVLGMEVLRWANSVFGPGDKAITEAHVKLRLFLAMSETQVRQLINVRRVAKR